MADLYVEKFFLPKTATAGPVEAEKKEATISVALEEDLGFKIPYFMRILKEEVQKLHGETPPFGLMMTKVENALASQNGPAAIQLLDELEELLDIFEKKENT